MAQVLNYARLKHIPAGAVYIGRGMPNIPENPKFKNPFKMHNESQRQEVCDKYRNHLWARLFWQDDIFQKSCWVLHHLPPGV